MTDPGGGEDTGPDDAAASRVRAEERRPGAPFSSPMTGSPDGAPSRVDGIKDRVRSVLGLGARDGDHVSPPAPKPTREVRPGKIRGRLSAADAFTDTLDFAGQALAGSGRHVPLGRYLVWEAPAAGVLLDEAVKDSIVDKRLIQPAVRAYDRLGIAAAVLGPPVIILQIERTAEHLTVAPDGTIFHPLFPLLKLAIRRALPDLVPAMKKARDREEKLEAAVRELWPDLPEGADPADAVIAEMFQGLRFVAPEPPAPAPQEPAYAGAMA